MEMEMTLYQRVMLVVDAFFKYLVPVSFVIIFLVQLKMLSLLRSQMNLMMFYGKQIEELRKMAGAQPARRLPEAPTEEGGLYEVLRE